MVKKNYCRFLFLIVIKTIENDNYFYFFRIFRSGTKKKFLLISQVTKKLEKIKI